MSWNNGYERRKFEAEQEKLAEEYRALGMGEEQIKDLYEFDLAQFNSKRRYYTHIQEFTTSDFEEGENDESESTLLHKFFDELTVTIADGGYSSRYWWIEEIDDPYISKVLKSLSKTDLEIITLMVIDEFKHEEIAQIMGVSVRTIERKRAVFRKIFKKN